MARDFTDILSAVWAANALTTIPNPPIPGQAYRNTAITDGDLSNGQQYSEVYDSARYNQLLYLLSGCLKMLMETGLPEWSAEQNYQQNAYTIGSDGKLYGPAKKASGPDNGGAVDPVTDAAGEATTWTLSLPDFEAPLAFDAAEGKVKLSVGNTTTVTGNKLEAKLDANGGLGSSSAGIKVTPSNGVTVNSNGVGVKAGNGIVVSASGVGVKPVSGSPVTVTANGLNVSTFTPPTADTPGKAGLVPGPGAGKADAYLRGDGTWSLDVSGLEAWRKSMIGAPVMLPSPVLPAGYMWADGTLASFADWPELKEAYQAGKFEGYVLPANASDADKAAWPGKWVLAANSAGLFLPRLEGLFARYCSKNNAGKHNAAGLPNVTGELASGQNQSNDPAAVASNGGANNAFTTGGATAHSKATITTTATIRNSISISFLASRSNGIYGASTTVMPASVETPIALYLGRPTKV